MDPPLRNKARSRRQRRLQVRGHVRPQQRGAAGHRLGVRAGGDGAVNISSQAPFRSDIILLLARKISQLADRGGTESYF
jgi:hypothetical protein